MTTPASLNGHLGNATPASDTAEDAREPAMSRLTIKSNNWAAMSDAGFSSKAGKLGGSWSFGDKLCSKGRESTGYGDYRSQRSGPQNDAGYVDTSSVVNR